MSSLAAVTIGTGVTTSLDFRLRDLAALTDATASQFLDLNEAKNAVVVIDSTSQDTASTARPPKSASTVAHPSYRDIAVSSARAVPIPAPIAPHASSQLLAEWHGQVLSLEAGYFVAELRGTTGAAVSGSHEEAQIPMEEVREADRDLLAVGAFFRLCVNWEMVNGSRRRYTDVVFRRMPAYRRDELERARSQATEIFNGLRVE